MTIPAKVGELLAQGDVSTLPGKLNIEEEGCEGAKFHSPNPLLVSEVPLVSPLWPGVTTLDPLVWLCGNCADNLRVYQLLLGQHAGQLEWPIRREFGNLIRALGDKGWKQYCENLEVTGV